MADRSQQAFTASISKTPTRRNQATALILFTVVFVVHCTVAVAIGTRGWDDGAITVSFAHTLADWGRIALTPHSEVVEGFSSPLWMLLLAGTYRIIPLDFGGMILASQLWSAFFAAVGSVILFRLLHPFLRRAALPVSFAVFVSGVFLSETANGMEMSALSALALATVWLVRRHRITWAALFTVAALAPWVRFEAAGYVIAGAVMMILVSRDRRRATALVCGSVVSLAVLTALRLALFDSIVANTILAKRWAPYPHGGSLSEQISMSKTVVKELLYVVAPGAVVAVGGLLGRRSPGIASAATAIRSRSVQPAVGYAAGYLLGVAGFNVLIGPNWGYLGRMEQPVVALTVVAVVYCAPRAMRSLEQPWRLTAVVSVLLALAAYGIDRERIDARWHSSESDGQTPAAFRMTGLAADNIRDKLGLPVLSLLSPDVGGASLCCSQLETLDLGLLANRELARTGYDSMESYLVGHKPDAVVTHSVWSDASKLYGSAYFRENYSPVAVDEVWFYLRDDLLSRLAGQCRPLSSSAARQYKYRGAEVDEDYIRTLGDKDICALD